SYQRRVSTHYLLAKAVLQVSAADPDGLLRRLKAARTQVQADRSDLIITHEEGERDIDLPLIDAESGAPRLTPLKLLDSRGTRPAYFRARPAGYLVLRGAEAVKQRLALNEARVCEGTEAASIAVEAYDVARTESKKRRESINPDQMMRVQIKPATIAVPAGA